MTHDWLSLYSQQHKYNDMQPISLYLLGQSEPLVQFCHQ